MAVRRRRTPYRRVDDDDSDKEPRDNEKLSGIFSFIDENGDQRVSYEYCEQSNAIRDQSQKEQKVTQEVEENGVEKVLSGSVDLCIKRIKIVKK